jgi:hypothetical protein
LTFSRPQQLGYAQKVVQKLSTLLLPEVAVGETILFLEVTVAEALGVFLQAAVTL